MDPALQPVIQAIGPAHHDAARRLVIDAFPFDHLAVVSDEKLFGTDPRPSRLVGIVDAGQMVAVMAQAGRFIKLLAVAQSHRRRGLGRRLVEDAALASPGKPLGFLDQPGNYLSPGLDIRYRDGRAFASRLGFRETGEVENLRVPLTNNPLVDEARALAADARAIALGYAVRRVGPADRQAVLDYVDRAFAAVWAFEVARALDGPRAAVHAAFSDGMPIAFAAADGNNQGLGWFGPAGTDPSHRGRGLGEAMLLRCLLVVRGLPDGGVIAWIGPKAFYARAAGAVEDRTFVTLKRDP